MKRTGIRLGLAPKFTFFLTLFILAVMGFTVDRGRRQQSAALDHEVRERGKALARAVANNSSEPLALGTTASLEVAILVTNVVQQSADPTAIRKLYSSDSLASLVWADMLRLGKEEEVSGVQNEGVLFAKVVDPAGNIIAAADAMKPPAEWTDEMMKPYQPEPGAGLLAPGQAEQVWESLARGGIYVIGIPVLTKGADVPGAENAAVSSAVSAGLKMSSTALEAGAAAAAASAQLGTVYLGMSKGIIRRAIALAVSKLLLAGVVALVLGVLAAFFIVTRIVQPIQLLRTAVLAVAGGDYKQHVRITRHDELGDLAGAFNGMTKGLAEREIIRNAFGSYVSHGVLDQILKDQGAMKIGGARRLITVVDTDVSGFTAMSARLTPEDVVKVINVYLDVQTKVILEHGGYIDRFVGDEIYAIFGVPEEKPDDAERAVRCAVALREAVAKLIEEQRARNLPDPRIKIGVDTGTVVAGNMGAQGVKVEYAVVGEPVGAAHEIMDVARDKSLPGGQIVLSANTFGRVKDLVEVRDIGEVSMHGRNKPLRAFELIGMKATPAAAAA